MNCQRVTEQLADLHDGLLPKTEASAIKAHLGSCASCQKEWQAITVLLETMALEPEAEPSPRLRAGFNRMLAGEIRRERNPAPVPSLASRLASLLLPFQGLTRAGFATALLAIGLGTGFYLHKPAVLVQAPTEDTQKQLADLRNRVEAMNQLVADSFQQNKPESSRLIQTASFQRNDDSHQLAKLIGVLAFDPSTNVRLSALEALYAHADKPIVRQGLVASLPRERSPLVQLAMIDFLASINEPAGNEALKAVVRDTSNDQAVRDAAQRAMTRL